VPARQSRDLRSERARSACVPANLDARWRNGNRHPRAPAAPARRRLPRAAAAAEHRLPQPWHLAGALPCCAGLQGRRAMIRPALAMDVSALCAIYNHYVVNTCVSFEEEAVAEADFAARVATVREAGLPYLVAEEHGVVVGYAYASRWK